MCPLSHGFPPRRGREKRDEGRPEVRDRSPRYLLHLGGVGGKGRLKVRDRHPKHLLKERSERERWAPRGIY